MLQLSRKKHTMGFCDLIRSKLKLMEDYVLGATNIYIRANLLQTLSHVVNSHCRLVIKSLKSRRTLFHAQITTEKKIPDAPQVDFLAINFYS